MGKLNIAALQQTDRPVRAIADRLAPYLQILVDELEKDCSLHIHDKNVKGNNFASFSHRSAFADCEINAIIALFCGSIEHLLPKARKIWDSCCTRKLDAGFESGNSPKDFQSEIRADVIKRVAELDASIAITIYPIND